MNRKAIIEEYALLRQRGIKLSNELLDQLDKRAINSAAAALGMTGKRDEVVFQSEQDYVYLMDYAIHEVREGGLNAVERLVRDWPPDPASLPGRLLAGMLKSRFSIFRVTDVRVELGIEFEDLRGGQRLFCVDRGFSITAAPGMEMAVRLFSPGTEWFMTTGAGVPLGSRQNFHVRRELDKFAKLEARDPTDAEYCQRVMRACIASRASENIVYSNTGETPSLHLPPINEWESNFPRPSSSDLKIGRNVPCPCGSGRKYKICCGK